MKIDPAAYSCSRIESSKLKISTFEFYKHIPHLWIVKYYWVLLEKQKTKKVGETRLKIINLTWTSPISMRLWVTLTQFLQLKAFPSLYSLQAKFHHEKTMVCALQMVWSLNHIIALPKWVARARGSHDLDRTDSMRCVKSEKLGMTGKELAHLPSSPPLFSADSRILVWMVDSPQH